MRRQRKEKRLGGICAYCNVWVDWRAAPYHRCGRGVSGATSVLRCGICSKDVLVANHGIHLISNHRLGILEASKKTAHVQTLDQKPFRSIREIFTRRGFVIAFEDHVCILGHHKKLGHTVFALKYTNNLGDRTSIILDKDLPAYLTLLVEYWNAIHPYRDTKEIVEREGALTKYGWRAAENDDVRHSALETKTLVESREETIGTLKHLLSKSRWGSPNSQNFIYAPIVESDLDWVLKNFPPENSSRAARYDRALRALWSQKPGLKNIQYPRKFFSILVRA